MLNTLFCFINQKQNKTKTIRLYLLITVVQHMTDNAVSEFSHLPESQVFFFYFIIALTIQTDICGHGISFYFFQKVWVFGGSCVFWIVVSDMSGWLGLKTAEKVSHIITVQYLWSRSFPVCQFASFFDASSKFSTRSVRQNTMKRHT